MWQAPPASGSKSQGLASGLAADPGYQWLLIALQTTKLLPAPKVNPAL